MTVAGSVSKGSVGGFDPRPVTHRELVIASPLARRPFPTEDEEEVRWPRAVLAFRRIARTRRTTLSPAWRQAARAGGRPYRAAEQRATRRETTTVLPDR